MKKVRCTTALAATTLLLAATPSALAGGVSCDGRPATIVGTQGRDTLVGTAGSDVIAGLDGADHIKGLNGRDALCGDDGNDRLGGGGGRDRILGGAGDDLTRGRSGPDSIEGGAGDDQALGGVGRDTMAGDAGNDDLNGGQDQNTLTYAGAPNGVDVDLTEGSATGEGQDTIQYFERLIGSPHDDVLGGHFDSTWFVSTAGNDEYNGLSHAWDQVSYATADQAITADAELGTATGHGSDTLSGIDGLVGSDFDDTLRLGELREGVQGHLQGGAGDDDLAGGDQTDGIEAGAGDDVVNTLGGDDFVYPGAGNDDISTGGGHDQVSFSTETEPDDDTVDGGPGATDMLAYNMTAGPVSVDLAAGVGTGQGGTDSFSNVEAVWGTESTDELRGNEEDNFLGGGYGEDDLLEGRGGADTLHAIHSSSIVALGGEGADDIEGGPQTDEVSGGPGNDTIRGDEGNDDLQGEAGDDDLNGGDGIDDLDGGADVDVCRNGETLANCESTS
ncbi:MAG: hypothetical protein M3198_01960 [Actinomycetota bacterium]|nr:hypothetical protein [Actinomycetota bacterium]